MGNTKSILSAHELTIGYRLGKQGQKRVHEGVSFELLTGKLTCLLGPNGAGKSTLLRTLGGTQSPLGGELFLRGRPLKSYNEREISRLIGLVLTDKTASGGLRVQELVALGRHPHVGFFGRLTAHDERVVQQAMDSVGIAHKGSGYVAELSDGERQKVMVAKTLAQECPIILLDEPTAFLDVVSRIEMMNLLHRLAGAGKTILLTTHDIEQALLLTDQLWLLSKENGLRCGTTEDLVFQEAMQTFFGREGITFDKRSGSFRSIPQGQQRISIEADDALLFWTKNMVMRCGFQATNETSDPADIRIKTQSYNKIELHISGTPQEEFSSFEALGERLKTLK